MRDCDEYCKNFQEKPWRNFCGNAERMYRSNPEKNSGISLRVIRRNFAWEILVQEELLECNFEKPLCRIVRNKASGGAHGEFIFRINLWRNSGCFPG